MKLIKIIQKITSITLVTLLALCFLLIAISCYGFLHLNQYTSQINNLIYRQSGYHLAFDHLKSTFNSSLQPELELNNIKLYESQINTPLLAIKNLKLALSYQSLFELKPIFALLKIEGSQIALELDKNNNLLLNQQIISNLNAHSSSPTPFDIEELIFKQKQISLSQINFSFSDNKHNFVKPIIINDLKFNLLNPHTKEHNLNTNLQLGSVNNLQLAISFTGEKLTGIENWQTGFIYLHNLNKLGYIINLKANIKNGSLANLVAKFDSNQQALTNINNHAQNLTMLGGEIKIIPTATQTYQLEGKNLTINTKNGYILNNAHLLGNYQQNHGGFISLDELNLAGFSSLLALFPASNKLFLSGSATSQINWQGNLSKPHDLQTKIAIRNLALNSNESLIPSLNNLNADLTIYKESGQLNLSLNNSTLKYPQQMYQTLKINNFSSNLLWQLESNTLTKISWQNTQLQTDDVSLLSNGLFYPTNKHLVAQAQVKEFSLPAIIKYLPKVVSKDIISYLQKSLVAGKLKNGLLTIDANVNKFPLNAESDQLKFTAQINNASYKFMPEWGPLSNTNAKLTLDKKDISLILDKGQIGHLNLTKGSLTLPNWTSIKSTLAIKTQVDGTTNNYLNYLQSTPYVTEVTKASNLINIEGNSNLKINLELPLSAPSKFKLDGKYSLLKNQLILNTADIAVKDINGNINFNQHGLSPSKVTASAFDSDLILSLKDQQELHLYAANLDYNSILDKFYPPANQIISGRADTNITYNLQKQNILLSSNLNGVKIAGVAPLLKDADSIAPLNITLQNISTSPQINLNYANILHAQAQLKNDFAFDKLQVALGTSDYQIHQTTTIPAPISVRADLSDVYLMDWANLISKLTANETKAINESINLNTNSPIMSTKSITPTKASVEPNIYPIAIEINSSAFWLNNYNLDGGRSNILLTPIKATINIATPDIAGKIDYFLEQKYLNIALDKLIYANANFMPVPQKEIPIAVESITTSSISSSNLANTAKFESPTLNFANESAALLASNESTLAKTPSLNIPRTDIKIKDLYYQNHYLGSFNGHLFQENNALYFESLTINNTAGTIRLNLSDNCLGCSDEFVAIIIQADINDFGLLFNKLDFGDTFAKGHGQANAILSWPGGLTNFDPKVLRGKASLDIRKGQLVHVNPGFLGSVFGVISLQSITSFNLNNIFGKGFAYDSLTTQVRLKNQQLKIEKLNLAGELAEITTFGNLNLESNTIDTYLTLEPKLGNTVATTAGIVTLNPFIGIIVWLGQKVVGDPVNKALAVSYHVTGDIESPTLTQTKITEQLMQNFNSSLDIINFGSGLNFFQLNNDKSN